MFNVHMCPHTHHPPTHPSAHIPTYLQRVVRVRGLVQVRKSRSKVFHLPPVQEVREPVCGGWAPALALDVLGHREVCLQLRLVLACVWVLCGVHEV